MCVVSAAVRSVNAAPLGRVRGLARPSGIQKRPVDRIEVRDPGPKRVGLGSGVVGDAIGNKKFHGGESQAVYAFAREELDWWERELGRELPDGAAFGENVTTTGLEVDDALVGERWRVGTALLEVCRPRTPCATFAAHMGELRWMKRFAARERVGAYLAVVEAGVIEPGDPIEVVERPDHDVTVPMLFRAVMGDRDLGRHILDAEALRPSEHEWLAGRFGR